MSCVGNVRGNQTALLFMPPCSTHCGSIRIKMTGSTVLGACIQGLHVVVTIDGNAENIHQALSPSHVYLHTRFFVNGKRT